MNPRYDSFFKANFNTPLTPKEEKEFHKWAVENQRDPDMETIDYDLRGFWKDGGRFSEGGHGSDLYKKPNHPTFSNESKWHNTPTPSGGMYIGGQWDMPDAATQALMGARPSFTPSEEMLRTTHTPDALRRYFNRVEPSIELRMPTSTIPMPESYRAGGRTSLI